MITHEIKKLPQSEMEIKVTVSWNEWEKYISPAVESISKNLKVDGFRPGKAPRKIVEQKVGLQSILEEAADKVINKTYPVIVGKEKINAIGSPRAEILKIVEGNELVYVIRTAIMPEIRMNSWKEKIIKINRESGESIVKVDEADIDNEIKKLAESRSKLVTVLREARIGDSVMVDFQILREGVPIENGTSRNHPLILGKKAFIPGFEEQLVGMKEKDEKEFELKFPEEYYEKSLAGKPAFFKVKVNLVQERQIPEINDEFAKSLGKFENLDELKKSVSDGLKTEKENKNKEEKRGKFADVLAMSSEVDLPDILVSGESRKMVRELESQLAMMGADLDGYLNQIKKTVEELESDWKPQAEKRLKAALALEELAKIENIEIPAEEIEVEMNKALQYYKRMKDAEKDIDLGRMYNYVKGSMLNEKVFEYLEKL